MKDLMSYINEQTNNAYQNVKLIGVVYDKDSEKTSFRFVYHNMTFTQKDKEIIYHLIDTYYNHTMAFEVKAKKDYVDEEVVKEYVYQFIITNHSSIASDISKKNIEVTLGENVKVVVSVYATLYDYLVGKGLAGAITDYLNSMSFEKFVVDIVKVPDSHIFEKALRDNEYQAQQKVASEIGSLNPTKIEVSNVVNVVGGLLSPVAIDLGRIKGAMQKVQIAGKIRYFSSQTFTSKRKDASGNFPQKTYYRWSLSYGTNSMQCVYFPKQEDVEKITHIVDDMTVLVSGDVEEYGGRLSMKVKCINTCTVKEVENEIPERTVNDEYLYVRPTPHIKETQFNFFDVPKEPNPFLKQNDVVVFDVETTGLDYRECEIIEIGAVKLHEGEIVENFSCFVRPSKSIPADITNLTGITDDMVKDAYPIKDVIVDFYKFCYNCVIVAYNIDFDFKFINKAGTAVGYRFTNRQVDALFLARKNVVGAKNFTLKSIATKLGVSLEGAHRAINDATATAEVLKLISDNVSPN